MDNQLTPIQNLAVFIQTFNPEESAQSLIDQIDNGDKDIKEVMLAANQLAEFAAILKTRCKDGFLDSLSQFDEFTGKEKSVTMLGMKIKNNGDSVSYSYDACCDSYLNDLQNELADKELELTPIKKNIKDRLATLQKAKCSFADEFSGGETVYPAISTKTKKQPTITRL